MLLQIVILYALAAAPQSGPSIPENGAPEGAGAIMAKVAANVEKATAERRQYIYDARVRSSLVRSDGQVARREKREYTAIPGEKATEKQLVKIGRASCRERV